MILGLTLFALRMRGTGEAVPWRTRDTVLLVAIAILIFIALPWILADLGFYVGDIPPLGHLFMSKQVVAGESLRAVHLGHHHGLDGMYLAIAALILGRQLGSVALGWLRGALSWYLPLMVAYGLANIANDAWQEQVVKRGWTEWRIPDMLRPHLSIAWGILLLGMIILRLVVFRPHAAPSAPEPVGTAADPEPRGDALERVCGTWRTV
jgi:hypothetical protein